MRLFTQTVFDEFIVGSTATTTSPAFDELIGRAARLSIQAVVDKAAAATISVRVQHSADRRNWSSRNAADEISAALAATITNDLEGVDPGTNPGLRYGRLRLSLGGVSPVAHVRISVTGWSLG